MRLALALHFTAVLTCFPETTPSSTYLNVVILGSDSPAWFNMQPPRQHPEAYAWSIDYGLYMTVCMVM